jgi:putative DNA primase/helicase
LSQKKAAPPTSKKRKTFFESPYTDYFRDFKVDEVDDCIQKHRVIKINYDEFPEELQREYDYNDNQELVLTGLKEAFKERAGDIGFNSANSSNAIKFEIIKGNDESIVIDNTTFETVKQDDKDNIDRITYRLIRKYHFITIRESEEILLFNGKIYDNAAAESTIKEECEKQIEHCKEFQTKEVINKIKRKTYTTIESFDKDPREIVLDNGILNIETGKIRDHTHNHYSRILFPVSYKEPKSDDINENLKGTTFLKFLKNSFTDVKIVDKKIIDRTFNEVDFETVLEIMASFLIRQHIDRKAFLFLGDGENGKSVLMAFLEAILGTDNVSNTPLQELVNEKVMMADLQGKIGNLFPDLENDELRHSGKLKALVCDEKIRVRKLYQNPFTLVPKIKLLFSCNLFPKVRDQSHGFFSRWIIVNWNRNFEKDPDKIPNLSNLLCNNKEEINLVFSCLVGYAKKLLHNQKFTHTKDEKNVKKQWLENSNPLESWIRKHTKESINSTSLREAHDYYKDVMFEKGETPEKMHKFNLAVGEEYSKHKLNVSWVWLNMELVKNETLDAHTS